MPAEPLAALADRVICGTPTPEMTRVVQIEPGPDADLHRVGPGLDQGLRPFRRRHVAGDHVDRRSCCLISRTVSITLLEWPWAESTTSTSTPAWISDSARS